MRSFFSLLLVLSILLQSLTTVVAYQYHSVAEVSFAFDEHEHRSNDHSDADTHHGCHFHCSALPVIVSCQYNMVFSKQSLVSKTPYNSLFISPPASSLYRPPIA